MKLTGREPEIKKLNLLLKSKEAEFLAIYGRRRIGKTFLIEQHFKKELTFQLNGQKDGTLKEQLGNFHSTLSDCSRKKRELPGVMAGSLSATRRPPQNTARKGKVCRLPRRVAMAGKPAFALPSGSRLLLEQLSQ